jgi:phosphate transport system permease protein
VEYGRGRFARIVSFMVDILTGVPSIVGGPVHLRRLHHDLRLHPGRHLRLPLADSADDPGRGALDRGDAQARAERAAGGVLRARGAEVEDDLQASSCRPPSAGIVTGVLLGLARVMGETAPLLILGPYTKAINLNLFGGNMATLPDHDQPGTRQAGTCRHTTGLGGRAHADPAHPPAQPDRAPAREPLQQAV